MLQRLVKIDGQHRSAAVLDRARAVVVKLFVVVRADVAAREAVFQVLEEGGVDRHHVFEMAVLRAILHHQDLAVALDDLRFDFADFFIQKDFVRQLAVDDLLPDLRNALGQSESVSRGQPSGGLVFSQDFSSGLSDHFGVNDGFWLMLLALSKTCQAALAAYVRAFSAYLIGLCIGDSESFIVFFGLTAVLGKSLKK